VPPQAGKYQFAITAASNCPWTARADVLWADVSPSSGTGNGTPVLQISEQTVNDSRGLTLTINGQGYRVTQSPVNCIYTLDRTSVTAAEQGERVQLGLTVAAGCPWSASTTLTWVRVVTPAGNGSDHVDLEISPNTGALRQGTVLVAGHTVQVTQQRGN
jgi:Viral BACON domain